MFSLKTILISLFLILFIHLMATIGHWYWAVNWFDILMHFLGGLWVAMVFGYLNQRFFKLPNFWTRVILTFSFVALIGILWEFFEFSLDNLFFLKKWGPFQGGLSDTMGDLFFDLLGGLFFLIIDHVRSRISRRNSTAT